MGLLPNPCHAYFSFVFQVSITIPSKDKWNNCQHCFGNSSEQLKFSKLLTPQKLYSSSHSSYCSGDEIRHTATHEGSESYHEEQATAQARHYGTDPPFCAGDALEGGIAPTFLHHHHHLPTLVMHWIWAPPERAKGHRFAQLRSPEPVRHKEPHTGGGSTKKGEQSPDHPGTSQAGCHLSPKSARRTWSDCTGTEGVSEGV